MGTYTVYKHTSPNGKVYIGITKLSVERRWQEGKNYKTSSHFNNAIKNTDGTTLNMKSYLQGFQEAKQKQKK